MKKLTNYDAYSRKWYTPEERKIIAEQRKTMKTYIITHAKPGAALNDYSRTEIQATSEGDARVRAARTIKENIYSAKIKL